MTNRSRLALVVSRPGDLQNGLLALLTTIPQIGTFLVAEDVHSALRMVENHQPTLTVLDISMPGVQEIIRQFKDHCQHNHLIVLVENISQGNDAEDAGADWVLVKGFPAQKLIAIVESLLGPQGSLAADQPSIQKE